MVMQKEVWLQARGQFHILQESIEESHVLIIV
jgi:hypothetical protein